MWESGARGTVTLDCLEEEALRPTEECWRGMFDSTGTRGSLSSIEIMTEVKGTQKDVAEEAKKKSGRGKWAGKNKSQTGF